MRVLEQFKETKHPFYIIKKSCQLWFTKLKIATNLWRLLLHRKCNRRALPIPEWWWPFSSILGRCRRSWRSWLPIRRMKSTLRWTKSSPMLKEYCSLFFFTLIQHILWDTRVLWTGTVEIHVCSKSKISMVLIATDISVALGLLFLRKIKIFFLCKSKSHIKSSF